MTGGEREGRKHFGGARCFHTSFDFYENIDAGYDPPHFSFLLLWQNTRNLKFTISAMFKFSGNKYRHIVVLPPLPCVHGALFIAQI